MQILVTDNSCNLANATEGVNKQIIIMTLNVKGNHVMYYRDAWLLRVIMSNSRPLSCLPLVKKQKTIFKHLALAPNLSFDLEYAWYHKNLIQ